jgi:hypothetical protein
VPRIMIDLPSSDVVAYLAQFKIAALYIAGLESGRSPCVIGAAVDLSRAVGIVARKWCAIFAAEPCEMKWAMWADRPTVARLIELTTHDMRGAFRGGGLIDAPLPIVEAAILAAARRLDVRLAQHSAVMAKVGGQVGKIAERVEGARQSGAMAGFNAEFKLRRKEAMKRGARFPSYGGALMKLRRVMAEHAAAQASGAIGPDVLSAVFGSD